MPGGDSRDEVLKERAFDGPVDKHGDIPPITDVKHMVPESRPTEATCLDSSIRTNRTRDLPERVCPANAVNDPESSVTWKQMVNRPKIKQQLQPSSKLGGKNIGGLIGLTNDSHRPPSSVSITFAMLCTVDISDTLIHGRRWV